jgi:SnoaL-like domain
MDTRRRNLHARRVTILGKEPFMTEAPDLVRRYLAAWNETDPDTRRTAIESVWAADGRYVDPLAAVEGHDQISALIDAAQQQMPGHVFRLLDGVDAHHNVARFWWELVSVDEGRAIAEGFDVAVLDDDGRIESVVGFLDKAPAA